IAVGMSVGAQATAALGAAVGAGVGFLTGGRGQRRIRAARWGAAGGKVGLAAGAAAGYYAAWARGLPSPGGWGPGHRVSTIWAAALGPPLGLALGWAAGAFRGNREQGAVVGGLAGAGLATVAACVFLMLSAQREFQGRDIDRVREYSLVTTSLV